MKACPTARMELARLRLEKVLEALAILECVPLPASIGVCLETTVYASQRAADVLLDDVVVLRAGPDRPNQ